LWAHGEVKLITGLNVASKGIGECLISFGRRHELSYKDMLASMIPEDGIGIMDRGFADWKLIGDLCKLGTLFIIRIKKNMTRIPDLNGLRIVEFTDDEGVEYRLATNVESMSEEEVAESYRQRWQIEILWRFLKQELKLDKLITKNVNGITLQIYIVLIVYLLLQLMPTDSKWGDKLLQKLSFVRAEVGKFGTFASWAMARVLCT
jgi:putative transposase